MTRRPRPWLLLLLAAGCAGTETGNPSVASQIALDAHSSDPASVALLEPRGGAVVDAVWLSLGELALVEGADCNAGAPRFRASGLGSSDHAAPGFASVSVSLEEGAYCELVLEFVPETAPPAGAPASLEGRTIVLRGALADGTPFELSSGLAGEVDVRAIDGSFALGAGSASMLLGFDVARWLSGVDFAAATRESDGSIVIDGQQNAELLAAFDASVAAGLELYRDADADGALDPSPELLGRGAP